MIEVRTYEDIYPAVEKIIDEMREAGFDRYADVLSHRMHGVAWTTGSELWRELVKVLSHFIAEDGAEAGGIALDVQAVLSKMREWFALYYPNGLLPFLFRGSRVVDFPELSDHSDDARTK